LRESRTMKTIAKLVVLLAVLLLSGCSLIQKGLEQITPEISVGIYKDGVGGVTVGVKLQKNPNAPELTPAQPKADEPKKEDE
jgi:hypothetical protein